MPAEDLYCGEWALHQAGFEATMVRTPTEPIAPVRVGSTPPPPPTFKSVRRMGEVLLLMNGAIVHGVRRRVEAARDMAGTAHGGSTFSGQGYRGKRLLSTGPSSAARLELWRYVASVSPLLEMGSIARDRRKNSPDDG